MKKRVSIAQNDLTLSGDGTLHVDLLYPDCAGEDHIRRVEIGLLHVRAADDIRISYDFDRDGYIIEQSSIFSWDLADEVCDPDWQEVAFIQAWAREKPGQPHNS